jgi:hypothetical protein
VAAKGQIVEKVASAELVLSVDTLQQVRRVVDNAQHVDPHALAFVNQPGELVNVLSLAHYDDPPSFQ